MLAFGQAVLPRPRVWPERPRGRHRDRALASWRRTRAIELRAAGLSYDQIAAEVGYTNRGTAHNVVTQALAALALGADVAHVSLLDPASSSCIVPPPVRSVRRPEGTGTDGPDPDRCAAGPCWGGHGQPWRRGVRRDSPHRGLGPGSAAARGRSRSGPRGARLALQDVDDAGLAETVSVKGARPSH